MKKNFIAFLLLAAFVFQSAAFAQAPAITISAADRKAAEAVTAKQLSDYLHFVASDEMEGRDTPSRGLDLTAKFIAMNLSRWGVKPAGDNGTYFQKIALSRESLDTENTKLEINGRSYKLGEDFHRLAGSGVVNGPMVFGRDGWMMRSKGIDSFAGVDVKDKVVVVSGSGFSQRSVTGIPAGVTQAELREGRGTEWADAVTHASQKGAVGLIVVAPPQLQNNWGQLRNLGRGGMYPENLRDEAPPSLPVILVSQAVGDAIFAGESGDRAASAAFAINKSANLAAATKKETLWTQNVVALWEGSDPKLKNEMVAIGSHYDHVGVNPNAPGDDKISNGADDDGSGTVAMLAMAEALAKTGTRPKRSILFVWHTGEEKGLWGSEYFNKFPTVDIKQVIAQLNIDMIGRSRKPGDTNPLNKDLSGPNEVYLIGSEMMSSTLGAIAKGTNNVFLKLDYNYKYDDPKDTNRFFFRSDHFNYAVNGIPVAFWFTGVHEDYHRVGDHADKIDYAKMEKITRTILMTLLKLADLNERPKIDKQLPPELSSR